MSLLSVTHKNMVAKIQHFIRESRIIAFRHPQIPVQLIFLQIVGNLSQLSIQIKECSQLSIDSTFDLQISI